MSSTCNDKSPMLKISAYQLSCILKVWKHITSKFPALDFAGMSAGDCSASGKHIVSINALDHKRNVTYYMVFNLGNHDDGDDYFVWIADNLNKALEAKDSPLSYMSPGCKLDDISNALQLLVNNHARKDESKSSASTPQLPTSSDDSVLDEKWSRLAVEDSHYCTAERWNRMTPAQRKMASDERWG